MPSLTFRLVLPDPRRCLPALAVAALWASAAVADPPPPAPLSERIDQLVEGALVTPPAALATEAEFLRRVFLDLVGRIPAVAEQQTFLADAAPDKRAALVDRLLASAEYARNMAVVFDVALMERRPEKNVSAAEWLAYLYNSFADNKPYDRLVREIVSADGVDPARRAAARFLLDREGEANLLTRDVGRIFLGVDLQCAQCHDHPLISDYYQADYHGLYAFFNRTTLFTDKEKKVSLAEKADGDVNYQSVFDATKKGSTGPKLPGGEPLAEPAYPKGAEYVVAPADNVRPVPKFSRRALLATELTAPQNRQFSRNIVNRLWAHMLGRGLVEPVDLHHGANPPSHPAVLELLADEFPAMKYDIKALLRAVALTRTYQRSIDATLDPAQQAAAVAAQLAALEAERQQAAAGRDAEQELAAQAEAQLAAARAAALPVMSELATAQALAADARQAGEAAQTALAAAQAALPAKQELAATLAAAMAQTQLAVGKLPDDKELADAAAKIKARSEQFAGEAAAVAKAVAEGPAAVKAAADQLAAHEQTAADVAKRLEPLAAQYAASRAQCQAEQAKLRASEAAALRAAFRVEDAQRLKAITATATAIAADQLAVSQADAAVEAVKPTIAAAQAEVDGFASRVAAAQQASAEAGRVLEEARKLAAEKKAASDALAEALAKIDVARAKLPDSPEVAQATQSLKTKADQLSGELRSSEAQVAEREAGLKTAQDGVAAAQQAAAPSAARLAEQTAAAQRLAQVAAQARDKLAADQAAAQEARQALVDRLAARGALATLKHLTPEQFAWSMMIATGVVDRERSAVEAEWAKNNPTPDAAAQAGRARQVEQALAEKLKPQVAAFVSLFAAAPGQPQQTFQATVDQALFLANGGQVRGWLAPGGGNLTERLLKLEDPAAFAEELYQAVFCRRPSADEVAEVAAYLASRPMERPAAVAELAWALFCSLEFRFNH